MNVLIFVTTMLMLLGIISYGSMNLYLNSQVVQIFFRNYMQKIERAHLEEKAESVYVSIVKTAGKGGGAKTKVNASRKISLNGLLDEETRLKNPDQVKTAKSLLKHLINRLFGDKPWFQNKLDSRPQLIDELIDAIEEASDALPKEDKLKKIEELETLKLANEDLNLILYQMLRTTPTSDTLKPSGVKEEKDKAKTEPLPEAEGEDNQSQDEEEEKETQSPEGFYSLLDGITLSKDVKVRIFLAPRIVLESIFQNEEIVNNLIKERNRLFAQANKDENLQDLSKAFESQFSQERHSDIEASTLDFSVSKTNPKDYE